MNVSDKESVDVGSVMKDNLIDRYVLLTHPPVLGKGHRLFADGSALTKQEPVDLHSAASGAVAATCQTQQEEGA